MFERDTSGSSQRSTLRPALLNLSPAAQLRAGRLPGRLVQLFVGLTLYGLSTALLIRSGLGMQPWTVLSYGIAEHVPLSIGTIVILVALAVLLAWIPLRQLPGLGTVANATWIGIALDLALGQLPEPTAIFWQVAFMVGGVLQQLHSTIQARELTQRFATGTPAGTEQHCAN